jgi:hypothetical protein
MPLDKVINEYYRYTNLGSQLATVYDI